MAQNQQGDTTPCSGNSNSSNSSTSGSPPLGGPSKRSHKPRRNRSRSAAPETLAPPVVLSVGGLGNVSVSPEWLDGELDEANFKIMKAEREAAATPIHFRLVPAETPRSDEPLCSACGNPRQSGERCKSCEQLRQSRAGSVDTDHEKRMRKLLESSRRMQALNRALDVKLQQKTRTPTHTPAKLRADAVPFSSPALARRSTPNSNRSRNNSNSSNNRNAASRPPLAKATPPRAAAPAKASSTTPPPVVQQSDNDTLQLQTIKAVLGSFRAESSGKMVTKARLRKAAKGVLERIGKKDLSAQLSTNQQGDWLDALLNKHAGTEFLVDGESVALNSKQNDDGGGGGGRGAATPRGAAISAGAPPRNSAEGRPAPSKKNNGRHDKGNFDAKPAHGAPAGDNPRAKAMMD